MFKTSIEQFWLMKVLGNWGKTNLYIFCPKKKRSRATALLRICFSLFLCPSSGYSI